MFDYNEDIGNSGDKLNKKLFKSKKLLVLEHVFIFLRLAFTDIWIKTKAVYFLEK